MCLRQARRHDLAQSAALHLAELPVGIFPGLGQRFLRHWHASFLGADHAVAWVATDRDGVVVGFLLGTLDHRAHVDGVLRDRVAMVSLAVHAGWAMATRPRAALRFARTRMRPWLHALYNRSILHTRGAADSLAAHADTGADTHSPARERVAVLVAIAVDPRVRGLGVGAQLVDCFETDATRAGAHRAELSTEVDGPRGAGAFYRRLGWQPGSHSIDRDGRTMHAHHKILGPPRSHDSECNDGPSDSR